MALIIAQVEDENHLVNDFVDKFNQRSVLMINQRAKYIHNHNFVDALLVVDLNPTLPPIYLLAIFLSPIYFVWKPILFVCAFFAITSIFFTRWFHAWAMKKGLRKAGYMGKIELVSSADGVRCLVWDRT